MKTTINKEDGRFKSLITELEDMNEVDCMNYLFGEIEKQVDFSKNETDKPNHFELFYINLFRECQEI